MAGGFSDVREFCLSILESGDLAAKLRAPLGEHGVLADRGGAALFLERPARDPELRMQAGAERLPRPHELEDPDKRASCLRRFAHHELMAVELFAWALLAWPAAPARLRRGWLETLADEQRHLGLYLERLRALGGELADEPLSDYFWLHVPAIRQSPHGPLAFLSAMGLTLEQANLDFTLLYRDAFRAAGDEASARVAQQVHDDECQHVRAAITWLERLKRPGQSDVEAYEQTVPFPLAAARAKGRAFSADARRRSGLSEPMIEYVRGARIGAPGVAAAPWPRLFPNLGAEEGERWRGAAQQPPVRAAALLWRTLFASAARTIGVAKSSEPTLPEALARDARSPAFAFLPEGEVLVPWLSTPEARELARRSALELGAADPEIVARVHDKAFAQRVAERSGLVPDALRGTTRVFDPEALGDADAFEAALRAALSSWPEPLRERFVLKPRFGSSGRGRVAGSSDRLDVAQLRGALPRLARCGGALLEPWLAREADLSVQLEISADGKLSLLGTLAQIVTPSGVPIGLRGALDSQRGVHSGSPHDAVLREAALLLADAAREAGYVGVCGVDAFVFRHEGVCLLRPVVELNARFTLGTIALGLVERARRAGLLAGIDAFELRLEPAKGDALPLGAHASLRLVSEANPAAPPQSLRRRV